MARREPRHAKLFHTHKGGVGGIPMQRQLQGAEIRELAGPDRQEDLRARQPVGAARLQAQGRWLDDGQADHRAGRRAKGVGDQEAVVSRVGGGLGVRKREDKIRPGGHRRSVLEPLIEDRWRAHHSRAEGCGRAGIDIARHRLVGDLDRQRLELKFINPASIRTARERCVLRVSPPQHLAARGQVECPPLPIHRAGDARLLGRAEVESQEVVVRLRGDPPPKADGARPFERRLHGGGRIVRDHAAARLIQSVVRHAEVALPRRRAGGGPGEVGRVQPLGQREVRRAGKHGERGGGAGYEADRVAGHGVITACVRGLHVENRQDAVVGIGDGGAVLEPLVVDREAAHDRQVKDGVAADGNRLVGGVAGDGWQSGRGTAVAHGHLVEFDAAAFGGGAGVVLHVGPGLEVERLRRPLRVVGIDVGRLGDSIYGQGQESVGQLDAVGNLTVERNIGEIIVNVRRGTRGLFHLRVESAVVEDKFDQRVGVAQVAVNLTDDDFAGARQLRQFAAGLEDVRAGRGPVDGVVRRVDLFAQFGTRITGSGGGAACDWRPENHRPVGAGVEPRTRVARQQVRRGHCRGLRLGRRAEIPVAEIEVAGGRQPWIQTRFHHGLRPGHGRRV